MLEGSEIPESLCNVGMLTKAGPTGLTERLADSWQVRERPSRQSVWTSSKQNAWFLLLWQSCPYINIGMRMEVERASGKVEAPVLGTSEAHVHSLAFPYLLGH